MLKINNNHKNDVLVIADCLEDDYFLYKKLYLKLARRFGFRKENVFVVTEKTFKQLAISRHGKDIDMPLTLFSAKLIVNLVDSEKRSVYSLCNIQREESFKKLFNEDDLKKMHTQYFGHYTAVCSVGEHPITRMLSSKMITNGDVVCTTNLVPNKSYLEELIYILNYLQNKKEVE